MPSQRAWLPPPPPAPPPGRRHRWVLLAICAVSALVVLAAAVVMLRPRSDHPDEWDARVADLAAFVERERGLAFEHPVTVEFLSEDEYSARARVDGAALSDEERAEIEDGGVVLEALGLLPPGTDMLETSNEMSDSGTLAFYDPVAERVVVRGTEVTTGIAVTLVHELVHVAQDQAFDLEKPPPDDSSEGATAYRALIEGDAMRIETAYVDSLDPDERDAWLEDYLDEFDQAQADLEGVPPTAQALFGAPYALGAPLVTLIEADGGNEAVDAAFRDPPATTEHLLDPRSYVDGDAAVDTTRPEVPDGADEVGDADSIGAIALFVMLSERVDALTALDAADGWGGDAYVAFDDGDRTCVRANLVGDTPADTTEIGDALRAWVEAGPSGVASVDTGRFDGVDHVVLESCAPGDRTEPGSGDDSSLDALDALSVPATRAQVMSFAGMVTGRGADIEVDEAFAVGDCFVRTVPLDVLAEFSTSADPSPEMVDVVGEAMQGCAEP